MLTIDQREYLTQVEYRARRFSGAWTGTSGTLAADCMRCLEIIKRQEHEMTAAFDERANEITSDTQTPDDLILQGVNELQRQQPRPLGAGLIAGDGMSVAEALLETATATILQRRKTYGPPQEHFQRTINAVNAIFSHKLKTPLTCADWAQIMILDKLARHQGDSKTQDTPVDLAGYAACLAECEAAADGTKTPGAE